MDDFSRTARRCYSSSKVLYSDGQFHNASYLVGYVVECYFKLAVQVAGHQPKQKHDLAGLRQDLNKQLRHLFKNSKKGGRLHNYIPKDTNKPFPNLLAGQQPWDPAFRYTSETEEWTEKDALSFQEEAKSAMTLIHRMEKDRVI